MPLIRPLDRSKRRAALRLAIGITAAFAVPVSACSSEPDPTSPPLDDGGKEGGGDAGVSLSVTGCPSCTLLVPNEGAQGLTVDDNFVYWSSGAMIDGAIKKVPSGGGPTIVVAGELESPVDVVAHSTGIYWVALTTHHTIDNGSVSWVPHAGGTPTILVEQQQHPLQLAIDDQSLFWTNTKAGSIMKLPIDGSFVATTLAKSDRPSYGIAVDDSSVYWTSVANPTIPKPGDPEPPPTGFVMRLSKNGGGEPNTLASEQANPMTIAVHAGYVYWMNIGILRADFTTGPASLMKVPVAGGEAVAVVANLSSGGDLAVDDQYIYYTTVGKEKEKRCDGTVEKVPISGGMPTIIANEQCWPLNVAIDATHVYFATAAAGITAAPRNGTQGIIKAPK